MKGKKLDAKSPATFTNGYHPEIDMTEDLGEDDAAYYHSLIGVL